MVVSVWIGKVEMPEKEAQHKVLQVSLFPLSEHPCSAGQSAGVPSGAIPMHLTCTVAARMSLAARRIFHREDSQPWYLTAFGQKRWRKRPKILRLTSSLKMFLSLCKPLRRKRKYFFQKIWWWCGNCVFYRYQLSGVGALEPDWDSYKANIMKQKLLSILLTIHGN